MFQCFLIGTFFYRKNQALIYCLDDSGNTFYPKGERRYFMIDYVKVWQNENYEQFIQDDSEFEGNLDLG